MDTNTQPDDARTAFLSGLEQIAAFLRDHPDVPLPYLGTGSRNTGTPHVLVDYLLPWGDPRQQLATITRDLADGGTVHKSATEGDHPTYLVWREFGPIALAYQANRDKVCERVIVGVEQVEVEEDACPVCAGPLKSLGHDGMTVCADKGETHYLAQKPGKRVATTEREIVEWRCQPLLQTEEAAA